jgi:hypothetical protein
VSRHPPLAPTQGRCPVRRCRRPQSCHPTSRTPRHRPRPPLMSRLPTAG